MASVAEDVGGLTRGNLVLALAAAALALVATAVAHRAPQPDARADRSLAPPTASPRPTRLARAGSFWIGAWCAPPARATTAVAWTLFSDAGIDVGIYPLEDRFRREDNLARLALLDSLNSSRASVPGARPIFAVVRDDSLHPDETLRAGWEGRLARARALYARHPSCVALFLADEPPIELVPTLAPLARAGASDADSLPGWFVNFIGQPPHPTVEERRRWDAVLETSVRQLDLPFFTVNSYASPEPDGESPNFLLALEETANTAYVNGREFGWLIQLTGHGTLPPANAAQCRMRVFEAIAHGATAIVWFTYWTPNPSEERWRWRGGLVDYATGQPTAQYAMVREVNAEARRCAAWWAARCGNTGVAHLGDLPAGAEALRARSAAVVPGLERASGGPITIAYRGIEHGKRKLLVVNRDTESRQSIVLAFDADRVSEVRPVAFVPEFFFRRDGGRVSVSLPPGGAIGLECTLAPEASASRP